jgi:cadmium resistance protein CadD (predicted permease)
VSKTSLGGLLLTLGLVMLTLFWFVVSLPSGLDFIATFTLGVIPAVVGAAMLWAGWRGAGKGDPEQERLASLKDQIIWRALAQDGRITAAEAAAHSGLPEMEVELALMSLVADGRASAEPGDGAIVYRIESAV